MIDRQQGNANAAPKPEMTRPGDQNTRAGGIGGDCRSEPEHQDSHLQKSLASVALRQSAAENHETAQHHRECVEGPLDLGRRCSQARAQRGRRNSDDGDVEGDEENPHRHRD